MEKIAVNTTQSKNISGNFRRNILDCQTCFSQSIDHELRRMLYSKRIRGFQPTSKSHQYKGFAADRRRTRQVLSLSARTQTERLCKEQQMAFLINAYNAFTVDVLLKYPDLKSIKDPETLFGRGPGKTNSSHCWCKRHLDWIEHDQLPAL
jgi:hypothetical protein